MKKNDIIHVALKSLVGLAIIAYIFFRIGIGKIFSTLIEIQPVYLLAIALLFFLHYFIGAVNIYILSKTVKSRSSNKSLQFYPLLKDYCISQNLGAITPGKFGDATVIFFLKKHGIPAGSATAIFLADKIISFVIIGLIAIGGLHLFLDASKSAYISILVILVPAIFIMLVASSFIRKIIRKYILRKYESRFKGFYRTFAFLFRQKKVMLANIAVTALRWIVAVVTIQLTFFAYGVYPGFDVVLYICSIISIFSLLPLTISGIGITEISAVYLFGILGFAEKITISVYIVRLVFKYLIALVLFIVFADFRRKK